MLPSLPDIPIFPPPARPRARTHPRYRQAQAYKRITRSQSQRYKLNTHQPPHLSHHQPPSATPPRGTCQERVRSVSAARHGQEEKSCCPRRRGGAQRPTPTPAKAPAPSCRETPRRDATRRDARPCGAGARKRGVQWRDDSRRGSRLDETTTDSSAWARRARYRLDVFPLTLGDGSRPWAWQRGFPLRPCLGRWLVCCLVGSVAISPVEAEGRRGAARVGTERDQTGRGEAR